MPAAKAPACPCPPSAESNTRPRFSEFHRELNLEANRLPDPSPKLSDLGPGEALPLRDQLASSAAQSDAQHVHRPSIIGTLGQTDRPAEVVRYVNVQRYLRPIPPGMRLDVLA